MLLAARRALAEGGTFCAWLYGAEGNRAYLAVLAVLRAVSRPLPHRLLAGVSGVLYWPLRSYMAVAARVNVSLGGYLNRVLGHLDADKIRLVIYDQLKTQRQVHARRGAGAVPKTPATDVKLHHRHAYSWTVTAKSVRQGRRVTTGESGARRLATDRCVHRRARRRVHR